MVRSSTLLAAVLLLAGCGRDNGSNAEAGAPDIGYAAGPQPAGLRSAGEQGLAHAQLAYRHVMTIEMPASSVALRYERTRDACLRDAQANCTLMNASISLADASYATPPTASLTVRLPHAAIDAFEKSILAPLPNQAQDDAVVRSSTTSADDLTSSVADVDRRERQLTDYRDRLTVLAARSDARVEDLVKVEGELSSVQSQLEAVAAEKSRLAERVETETLSIDLSSRPNGGSAAAPIRKAWHAARQTLGRNTGEALQFLIGALPWVPVVAAGLLFLRLAFRRWRR